MKDLTRNNTLVQLYLTCTGLLFKMHQMKIPINICKWIQEFLIDRIFYVHVNKSISTERQIQAGVPQGSVLSPILFQIFVNDIIEERNIEKTTSLLFADDLLSLITDKNLNRIQLNMPKHFNKIENRTKKLRLNLASNKYSYVILTKSNIISNHKIELSINDMILNKDKSPRYLGADIGR
jgi:retron-type reverse transcriptase